MSITVPYEAASTTDEPLANALFDYPGADIILRSQDCYHFRVPKIYIVNTSPILGKLIQTASDSPGAATGEASLPVVHVPKRGRIIHCLLTLIFPVTPIVPSTPEEILELLSVAQMYQMDSVLTHIRDRIARQNSLPTRLEPVLRIYSLAQKYGLRPEALQTARTILNYPMTIEDYDGKLDIMPGASLYELWKYHKRVRDILASDLTEFRISCAQGTIADLRCTKLGSSKIPSWLDQYIVSIGKNPNLFDSAELNIAMARHIKDKADDLSCECASIPSQTIRDFWEALAFVVDGSFEKAKSALCLVPEEESFFSKFSLFLTTSKPFVVPDANFIIRSSDNVNFQVHKSVLALASPFFKDLLSLPQPSDSETVDDLPVVQLSESSELLNCLVSILYPVRPVKPKSYAKVLYLLAACQKYEMASVQSSIRAEVDRGEFPVPKGAEAFRAYAIASANALIPEMESAARLTLDQPMTFEVLGNGLRFFEGSALQDLVGYRKRCRDSFIACLDPFIEAQSMLGPSSIWVGCPAEDTTTKAPRPNRIPPRWLSQLLSTKQNDLRLQNFTRPLDLLSRIRGEYIMALQNHATCNFCLGVHLRNGSIFCLKLKNALVQARDKVRGDCGSP